MTLDISACACIGIFVTSNNAKLSLIQNLQALKCKKPVKHQQKIAYKYFVNTQLLSEGVYADKQEERNHISNCLLINSSQ